MITESSPTTLYKFGVAVHFPIGHCIGFGAFAVCYTDSTDDSRVWVIGKVSRETAKHETYRALGLEIEIRQENDLVGARVPKLTCDAESVFTSSWEFARYEHAAQKHYHPMPSKYSLLEYVANDETNELSYEQYVFSLLYADKNAPEHLRSFALWAIGHYESEEYYIDNHEGNWLCDKTGKVLPIDLIVSKTAAWERRAEKEAEKTANH